VPRYASSRIPAKWRKLIRQIPGYDPVKSAATGDRFNTDEAEDACDFFPSCLRHVKGARAGQPFELETWQQAIIANLFGWQRKNKAGRWVRRYRETFIMVGRKNGKTPLAAGVILYVLTCDGEPGAEIYGAAAEYGQASLVFDHAKGMVAQDDQLRAALKVYAGQSKAITMESAFSSYKVISAEAFSKHGYNTHLYVIDEVHAQPDSELIDTLETSTAAREQPIAFLITTSDYEREDSICNEKHAYASAVRDNGGDPDKPGHDSRFLPVVYEASIDDDWTDPAVWAKANPNIGVSMEEDYLPSKCCKAQESPRFLNTFLRLHLNVRTQQDTRWLSMEHWDACAGAVNLDELEGLPCVGAIDLAKTSDMTAVVLAFKHEDDTISLVSSFFLPEAAAEHGRENDELYQRWATSGHLTLTSGNVADYEFIQAHVLECQKRFNVAEWPYDPWNATQFAQNLENQGLNVTEHRQGDISMSEPSKEFERLVMSHKIRHAGHPVLRWNVGNASVRTGPTGLIKPDKSGGKKRGENKNKIDGLVASIMAIGRLLAQPEDTASVYETRGLISL